MIGISLIDLRGLQVLARRSTNEFLVAIATAVSAILINISVAIVVAVVLSLADVIARQYRAPVDVLVPVPGDGYRYEAAKKGVESEPGLIVFRYGADLFFANANAFIDTVEDVVSSARTPVRWLILDASSISNIDYSASANALDLLRYLDAHGIHVAFARPAPTLIAAMDRFGLAGPLKNVQIFSDLDTAIAAFRADPAPASTHSSIETDTTDDTGKD
jgi:MFS superfamily sulfate permease-like transporter